MFDSNYKNDLHKTKLGLTTTLLANTLFLSLVISQSSSHTPQNTSDVIIYQDQPETGHDAVFYTTGKTSQVFKTTMSDDDFMEHEKEKERHRQEEMEKHALTEREEVLFVPTDGPINLDANVVHEDTIRMADVLENKKPLLSSIMKTTLPAEEESVLFIEGKNDERQDMPRSEERKKGKRKYNMDYDEEEIVTTTKKVPLDCVNLDCDNTIDSVCGAKIERKEWKYRLFLNECYFRKVNCMFNYESNRYSQVELTFCKNAGVHEARRNNQPYQYQPYVYYPMTEKSKKKIIQENNQPGRRMESRRAMAMEMGGGYCGHTCPTTCADFYKPECALSISGERRTFTNHCQLDRISCRTNTLWRRRPLAECVGGKKADMHQNRAFIGWMQKVGIVDNRGRVKMIE